MSSGLPTLRATWTTPQSDEPISQYHLQYRIHGTTSWGSQHIILGSPPPQTTTIENLAAGTEYNVRVRAVSAVGAGYWSAVQTERTYMSEFMIDNYSVHVLQAVVHLVPNWYVIIIYFVCCVTIIAYILCIYVVRHQWQGVFISWNVFYKHNILYSYLYYQHIAVKLYYYCTVPSQVTGVSVSKAIHSGKPALRVIWTAPQSDVPISQYQVEYKKRSTDWSAASPVSSGSTPSTLLEALDAGTVYEVRIRAVSAIGNGRWSEVESETTYKSELCSEFKLLESTTTQLMGVLLDRCGICILLLKWTFCMTMLCSIRLWPISSLY